MLLGVEDMMTKSCNWGKKLGLGFVCTRWWLGGKLGGQIRRGGGVYICVEGGALHKHDIIMTS